MQDKSINEFRMNFAKVYHSKILPILKDYEKERKKALRNAVLVSVLTFLCVAGVIIFFMSSDSDYDGVVFYSYSSIFAAVFAGVIAYSIYKYFQKRFERKLKGLLMPLLMPAFGDFVWDCSNVIGFQELKISKLFPNFEEMKSDDAFVGSYKNVPIRILETSLTYETRDSEGRRQTHVEFKGVLIALDIPKKFTGHTIVKKRSLINTAPYSEVKLEDPDFSKKFYVSSNDQVESRYLLTTAFMERYKNIQKAFNSDNICCSFINNSLLLGVSVNKDLFSLGSLVTPLTDTKQFTVFMNEIISIFELIEDLKLYQNTGL